MESSSLIHPSKSKSKSQCNPSPAPAPAPNPRYKASQILPSLSKPPEDHSRALSTSEESKSFKPQHNPEATPPESPLNQIASSSSSSSSESLQQSPAKEIVEASQSHLGMHSAIPKIEKLPVFLWENKEILNPCSKKSIKIFTLTWNMFGKPPPDDISKLLPFNSAHHIYVICTQECLRSIGTSLFYSSKKIWENKLKESLGENFYLLASNTLGATHVAVFIHFSLRNLVSTPDLRKVSTGFGNVVRNKGAVCVKFFVGGTSVLVVGCHLASGQGKVESRNKDFRRIERELFKDVSSEPASELFDVCIYMGDLNYRINGRKQDVELLLDLDIMEPLHKGDQLIKELLKNTTFSGFQEGPLTFNPTYRYDLGSSSFDTSAKQRVPSWTDRILYKSKGFKLIQKSYSSVPYVLTSDHRPVYSQFKMRYDNKVDPVKPASGSKTCLMF